MDFYDTILAKKFGGGGGGASSLAQLDDVQISAPTDNQALIYDESSQKWVNGNVGGENQKILYMANTMDETEINVDLTAYDEYIIFANDVLATSQVPPAAAFPKLAIDTAIANNATIYFYGYDDCACIYTVAPNKLTYNSGRRGYRITMIIGVKA